MIVTSNQANKLLKQLNDELEGVIKVESMASVYTMAIGENEKEVKPDYDFKATQELILSLEKKIRTVKHAINVFNTTTKLSCDLTIDEALVALPQLTKRLSKLNGYKTNLPKTRVSSGWSSKGVVEYIYTLTTVLKKQLKHITMSLWKLLTFNLNLTQLITLSHLRSISN